MQYVPSVLPAEPINGLTCGIDWARDDHAITIVDEHGRQVHRSTVEHSSAGLHELVGLLARTGATEVAIERPDGPVVDALLDAGITVVVISPNQVKTCAAATARRATKTTASTPLCSLIRCAPIGPDCARWCPTAPPRWRCARWFAPAESW